MSFFKSLLLIMCLYITAILLSGCSKTVEILSPEPPDIPIDRLLEVPESIVIQNRHIYFYTYLWRDFMPISPPGGKEMVGIVYITANDTLELAGIDCDAVWIVYNNQTWKSLLSTRQSPPGELKKNQISRSFNNGPKWGPNVYVDVIIRVIDSQKNTYLLKASKQFIYRTD